mgnify:CR=1 FL=1
MDEKKKQASGPVKWILIGISAIFLFVMLVLPLVVVVTQALSKGWQCYVQAVTDEYTLKALKLTIEATAAAVVCNTIFGLCAAWAMTRFHFRGKKLLTTLIDVPVTVSPVIAGLIYILVFGKQSPLYSVLESAGIQIVFAVPGIILATIFVTFPFVSREIIPVLESIGSDEEEAAALMGAKGWTILSRVTFPHIKWAFLYALCCVQPEPWESLEPCPYCPDISGEKQIHFRFMWKFFITNSSMFRHLRFLRSW